MPPRLDERPADPTAVRDLQRAVHKTIRRVSDDLERFKFNTALAALMEYTNTLSQVWQGRESTRRRGTTL